MIKSILKKVPQFSNIELSDIKLQKLAGLTNDNYLVTITTDPKQKYILRIPRESTNAFINRDDESHNAHIAEQLKIAPKNSWREASGISLTEYLNGTINPKIDEPKALENIAKTLLTLHRSKTLFAGDLTKQKIAKRLTQYYKQCSNEQQQSLKEDYQKTLLLLDSPLSVRPTVPSHIDLVLDNILLQNEKVWFIDWEYSAMASPFWDIAILCNSATLDSAKATEFLKMVLDDYQQSDSEHLAHYRFITKTVSDCWQAAFQVLPQCQ